MSTSKGEKTPRRYHHGDLRAELIRSAQTILEREGMAKLSLRAAARRTGVSQTAPYRHFTDKAALLAAVAAGGFRDLAAAMRAGAAPASDPAERMVAIGSAYLTFALEHVAVFHLMFGTEIADKSAHPELRRAADEAFAVLANQAVAGNGGRPGGDGAPLADDGVREADAPDAAIAAWSFIHGLATLLIDGQIRSARIDAESTDRAALVRRFGRFLNFARA